MALAVLLSFKDLMITVLEGIKLVALESRVIKLTANILHQTYVNLKSLFN
jgi:hypothetical protein